MNAASLAPPDVDELRDLTRQYARFHRNAAGLGNVIGGALALGSYLAGALLTLAPWHRVVFALVPLAWILAKEGLRRRFYQRYGQVRPLPDPTEQRWHWFRTGFVALTSLGVVGFVAWRVLTVGIPGPALPVVTYVLFVAAMPLLVWHTMRTVEEFVVGVFLVCQAAVVSAGGHYAFGVATAWVPLVAIGAVLAGIDQHRRFVRLAHRLERRPRKANP